LGSKIDLQNLTLFNQYNYWMCTFSCNINTLLWIWLQKFEANTKHKSVDEVE